MGHTDIVSLFVTYYEEHAITFVVFLNKIYNHEEIPGNSKLRNIL